MLLALQVLWVMAATVLAAFGTALFMSVEKSFAICADGAVQTYFIFTILTAGLVVLLWAATMAIGWLASFTDYMEHVIHAWTIALAAVLFVEGGLAVTWYESGGVAAIIVMAGMVVAAGEMFLVMIYAEAIASRQHL